MEWEVVIGLEIHAQLATKSKIFSGASTAYGAAPNTQACAVDLGLPGVLPVLNAGVVSMAAKFGLATHSTVAKRSVFARKNYFYPDLPKGYQISQYDIAIGKGGYLDLPLEDGSQGRRQAHKLAAAAAASSRARRNFTPDFFGFFHFFRCNNSRSKTKCNADDDMMASSKIESRRIS